MFIFINVNIRIRISANNGWLFRYPTDFFKYVAFSSFCKVADSTYSFLFFIDKETWSTQ